MSVTILDATGSGFKAKVDADNRLRVSSVNKTSSKQAIFDGDSFIVGTDIVTLTTDNESHLLYLKNTGNREMTIDIFSLSLGPSTGGSVLDAVTIRSLINPTTGTLISDATNVTTNINNLIGSSKLLTADVFMGAEGKTVTDGTIGAVSLVTTGLGFAEPGRTVMPSAPINTSAVNNFDDAI